MDQERSLILNGWGRNSPYIYEQSLDHVSIPQHNRQSLNQPHALRPQPRILPTSLTTDSEMDQLSVPENKTSSLSQLRCLVQGTLRLPASQGEHAPNRVQEPSGMTPGHDTIAPCAAHTSYALWAIEQKDVENNTISTTNTNVDSPTALDATNNTTGTNQAANHTPTFAEPQVEEQTQSTQADNNEGNNTVEMARTTDQIPNASRSCCLCTETVTGVENLKSTFPFHCKRCGCENYCIKCIKDWFKDACKNESKMPPKCCYAIPLATVAKLMNNEEIDLFKAKYEEWSTSNRLYCPTPACSAFISPRLYVGATSQTPPPSPPADRIEEDGELPESELTVVTKPTVACPDCSTQVCTKCHSFQHVGECPENDVDPELAAILEKWKIKRCPKCRTGVRKMYGCSHVECRCGAHFCYGCLSPYTACEGQCDEVGDDDYNDPEDFEEDDLDGRANYYDGDGRQIGVEPRDDAADIWGCMHDFQFAERETYVTMGSSPQPHCHECFVTIYFKDERTPITLPYHKEQVRQVMDGDDVVMSGTEEEKLKLEQQKWACFCGAQTCEHCPWEPPSSRSYEPSWRWRCDCTQHCSKCDRVAARATVNFDLLIAFECCECGKMVCGRCREDYTQSG